MYCSQMEGTKCVMVNNIIANVIHITLLSVLLGIFDLGFTGICIASTCSLTGRWLGSLVFMRYTSLKKISDYNNVPLFSKLTTQHLGYQAKICIN
jgi:Na+-driven multidrug efflux pump